MNIHFCHNRSSQGIIDRGILNQKHDDVGGILYAIPCYNFFLASLLICFVTRKSTYLIEFKNQSSFTLNVSNVEMYNIYQLQQETMRTLVLNHFIRKLFFTQPLVRLVFAACFFLFLGNPLVFAQTDEITVTGKVLDDRKTPIPGAVVVVKGTTNGTTTDADGNYSLSVPVDAVLVISNTGSVSREIAVKGRTTINTSLDTDVQELDEVVVVGYGTQTKKSLVGSLSKVNGDEVNRMPVATLDAQLQGKSTGLQINNNSGVPGDAVFVRVRGTTSINSSNTPLYIIDGVFVNNESLQTISTGGRASSPLADINPTDILSMEVLKDASATSIYGARGANGVIIITTKRGDYNTKPKVSFNASTGLAWAPKKNLWKLADGPTNARAVNDNYIQTQLDAGKTLQEAWAGRPFRPKEEIFNGQEGKGNPEEQETYDRLSRALRQAKLEEYDLSIQGGSSNTKYYLGGAYTKQQSVLKVADFERASLKINLDQKLNDFVTVGTSNNIAYTTRHQVGAGDGAQGNLLSSAALVQGTYNPIYNTDGTPSLAGNRDNVDVLVQDTDIKAVSTRYIGNLYADFKILRNLKFRTSWSADYNLYNEKGYWSDRMLRGANGGNAVSSLSQNKTWINEQTLNYRKNIGEKHTVGLLLGNTLQGNVRENTTATGSGFPNNSYRYISSASIRTNSETSTAYNLVSFFSRADYNYAGKYFVEASIRADGSSRFGENNRWGYFPSLGASWRIIEENFLKDQSILSDLKLRASVGLTGNQAGINDNAARGLWSGGAPYANNATGNYAAGTAPTQLANPDLKWETTRQVNAGIDIGVLKNRVTLEFNVYQKYTTDALLNIPVATSTGYSTYTSNAGETSNKGFELGISTVNIKKKDFTWTTNFNINRNINKVEVLKTPLTFYSRDWLRLEEGQQMYSFWLYKQLYVDPQTGDAVYEDVNGDGQITVDDRQILGSALPKFFGGLSNTVTYKGFDLSFLFTYQWGNKIWNHNQFLSMYGGTRTDRSLYESDANYWKNPGDQTDVPRFTNRGNNWALEQNNRLLEDGSFLRLKSLTLGYTLPKTLTQKYKVDGLRVYVTGTNLWLLTAYSGPDPESNVSNASDQIQGIDFGTPPQPTSFQVGINVTL